MNDSFNREINYLRISITDRCNLRCQYCMPKEGVSLLGHSDVLRYEEILRIVRSAVRLGIIKVRITGGEPLVRRGVFDFLKSLKAIEGLQEVTLTTNGVLLEEAALQLFESGIQRVNISLDSLNPSKYNQITRGGDLNKVLNGIRLAQAIGFSPIKINVVVMKGFNDDEIEDFAAMAAENPYQIRFIELMTLGQQTTEDTAYLSNEVIIAKIKSTHDLIPVGTVGKSDGPAGVYRLRGALGEIGFISAGDRHLCRTCNRIRLTADGHLRACLLSDKECDIRTALRSGCNDADLENIIKTTIVGKAESREIGTENKQIKKCTRTMSSIGG